jgi:Cu/Ag efflux protein CusF
MAIARSAPLITALSLLLLLLAALPAVPVLAQPAGQGVARAAAEAPLVDAEVRRVDPAKGTILLKHGEIRHLGMSPMTMGFKLRDPALAQGIKAGDKVRFAAVLEGETVVVTKIVKP